jgi:PAS domain S-box-containing protein
MMAKRKRSIRGKLTGIIMLTSTIVVLLASVAYEFDEIRNERNHLTLDLTMLAQVIGSNSAAALTFGDRKAASEVLSALRAKPSVIAAVIYTAEGQPFAQYVPNASTAVPRILPATADGFRDRSGRFELVYGIRLDGERVGTLYLASDARDRNARLKQYALMTAGIVLISLLIGFVLSWRLQRSISEPIVELARVANAVSQNKNYSMRASPRGLNDNNEIANLVTGFNSMLTEIQQRDDKLQLNQTQLEETVVLRTGELIDAKNAAEKIAEISARLARESASILNSATDGIMGVGLDNRPTFLNPAATRMLGVTLRDIEKKTIHQAIHHSYADGTPFPEVDCANTQAMSRGVSLASTQDTFWRRDGTHFPVEYSTTPMFDHDGNQQGAVVMFRDVTERLAIERLKSEFVSTVSHELRTPLTSIRGALGLLSSGLLGPIAEKGQRMLNIAVSNTDRLVRLINDILDLERIESGLVELVRGPVDANAIMVQTSEGLQSMADEAGVRLVVEPVTAALWGDSDRIIQTLTNLLGNAIKFSERDTTVTLSGVARERDFLFSVADQGRGVPEEKLKTIFERFSQVDASDSRDKGGSGLGLAICKSIVEGHGGRIWAEKNEPVGSRFQFTIPLATPSTVALPAINGWQIEALTPAAEMRDVAMPTILVVEDDLDLARVMTAALESHGMLTVHAVRGSDAIEFCRQHVPSLIVLDLVLSDMDGFAVVSAVREIATLGTIPLLVYSALDVGSADRSRLRLGPTEFLTKSRSSLADFEAHVIRLLESTAEGKHAA